MHNNANLKINKWQFWIEKSHQVESKYKRSNKILHLLSNSARRQIMARF